MTSERGYECEISCELGKEQQQMFLHKRQTYSNVQTFKKPISNSKHSNLEIRIHQNLYYGLVTFYWRIFEHPNGTGQCS